MRKKVTKIENGKAVTKEITPAGRKLARFIANLLNDCLRDPVDQARFKEKHSKILLITEIWYHHFFNLFNVSLSH